MKKKNKKQNGFSLIDVLIAMAILGFILLSLAQLMMVALYQENSARHHTTLLFFGQQQLEQLMDLPFTDTRVGLEPLHLALTTPPNFNCTNYLTERNAACIDVASFSASHKYLPPAGYYILVWTVAELSPGGSRAVTMYVIPNPPPEQGFKSPVTLTALLAP